MSIAPNALPQVVTKSYDSDRAMRNDMTQMLANGFTVQSQNITEHRGCFWTTLGIITLGILLFFMPKKKHYHVTYVKVAQPIVPEIPPSPAMPPPEPGE